MVLADDDCSQNSIEFVSMRLGHRILKMELQKSKKPNIPGCNAPLISWAKEQWAPASCGRLGSGGTVPGCSTASREWEAIRVHPGQNPFISWDFLLRLLH